MKAEELELLRRITLTPGVSGFESTIATEIRSVIEDFVPPENIRVDNIGNLIVEIGEGDKHLVMAAHMDEIGMVVSNIEKDGTLRIRTVGGVDARTILAREVVIYTEKGPVSGVIGIKAPHLTLNPEEAKKVQKYETMRVDVGTRSREETENLGIKILDPITVKKDFDVMNGKYIIARALDNRVGVYGLIQALKILSKEKRDKRITFVWTVQEEIGLRGAIVVSNTMRPDWAIAVDTYTTTDAPDMPTHLVPVVLGKGPVFRILDGRFIAAEEIRKKVEIIAQNARIPYQKGLTGGTTDASAMQETGSAVIPIGVPMRYTHSPVEVVHADDIDNFVEMLVAVAKGLN
jgi:putative aminopeptidase FrvX